MNIKEKAHSHVMIVHGSQDRWTSGQDDLAVQHRSFRDRTASIDGQVRFLYFEAQRSLAIQMTDTFTPLPDTRRDDDANAFPMIDYLLNQSPEFFTRVEFWSSLGVR